MHENWFYLCPNKTVVKEYLPKIWIFWSDILFLVDVSPSLLSSLFFFPPLPEILGIIKKTLGYTVPTVTEKPCLTATYSHLGNAITALLRPLFLAARQNNHTCSCKKPLLILYGSTSGKSRLTWIQILPVKDSQNCNLPRMPNQSCRLWNSFHFLRPIFIVNSLKPIWFQLLFFVKGALPLSYTCSTGQSLKCLTWNKPCSQ